MQKYMYDGPVMEFDRLMADRWKGETVAASVNKARSNLAWQFKKRNNRMASSKISLPGQIIKVE